MPPSAVRRVIASITVAWVSLVVVGCSKTETSSPVGPVSVETSATTTGRKPVVRAARIKRLKDIDGKPRFQLTAIVTDPDNDLDGGTLRLRILQQREILQTLIATAKSTRTVAPALTVTAPGVNQAGSFEGPAIIRARNELSAKFGLVAPFKGELQLAMNVADAAGNKSIDVGKDSLVAYGGPSPTSASVTVLSLGVVAFVVGPQLLRFRRRRPRA